MNKISSLLFSISSKNEREEERDRLWRNGPEFKIETSHTASKILLSWLFLDPFHSLPFSYSFPLLLSPQALFVHHCLVSEKREEEEEEDEYNSLFTFYNFLRHLSSWFTQHTPLSLFNDSALISHFYFSSFFCFPFLSGTNFLWVIIPSDEDDYGDDADRK